MLEFAPISNASLTYDEAVMYCFFLDYNGYCNWRLPTSEEYYSQVRTGAIAWHTNRNLSAWMNLPVIPVRTNDT